jgi:DNA (cytosine-5)-methyltransferase 1
MNYLSVCSGIEAATVAWRPLGWHAHAFAEIDKFPAAVLQHYYPDVPNYGDMTKFKEWPDACCCDSGGQQRGPEAAGGRLERRRDDVHVEHARSAHSRHHADSGGICARCGGTAIDLLVGGTPCQSFSVAGLRKGLDDPRGSLMLAYLALAGRYRPRWVVWENVPGVLSSDGGRAFGTLLGGLAILGYGFAYRILDAQYFRLAQRRKRVFVVGHLGDWRRAAAVLFERESLSGHPAPRRETGQSLAPTVGSGPPFSRTGNSRVESEAVVVAPTIPARTRGGGGLGTDFDCDGGMGRIDYETETPIAIQNATRGKDQNGLGIGGDVMFTLDQGSQHAVAFAENQRGELVTSATMGALKSGGGKPGQGYPAIAFANTAVDTDLGYREEQAPPLTGRHGDPGNVLRPGMSVRRLTPRECERLQGFPDDFTLIPYRGKPAADGPRYKALGNSMAVPVMAWIGRRIAMVNEL